MKAISIRQFNRTVKEITSPVELVTLSRESGTVVTLGTYYPKGTEPGISKKANEGK